MPPPEKSTPPDIRPHREVEIQLQVPADRRDAVRAAVARGAVTTTALFARYFDTPDRRLATRHMALRLRREGTRWVQALKWVDDGLATRGEHEVDRGEAGLMPAVMPELHADGPGAHLLAAATRDSGEPLVPVFSVDVQRTSRVLRIGPARVALAFDEGWIRAGESARPVCELEFEGLRGPAAIVPATAARWAKRFDLWIDPAGKAARGGQLADGTLHRPVAGYAALAASAMIPRAPDPLLRAMVAAALRQIVPNVGALAADAGTAGHVHQARVGLRRLVSVLRECGTWSMEVDPGWMQAARTLFRALGETRDRDVLEAWLLPHLRAAGAPPLELPMARPAIAASDACRAPAVVRLLLELIAFTSGTASAEAESTDDTRDAHALAVATLAKLHRGCKRDGRRFQALTDDDRHRARRRLKRLRYCAESFLHAFDPDDWRGYAARLKIAQDALGRFQDLTLAESALATAPDAAAAWFARGWLAAQRPEAIDQAGRALRRIGPRPRFRQPRSSDRT